MMPAATGTQDEKVTPFPYKILDLIQIFIPCGCSEGSCLFSAGNPLLFV